MTSTPRATQAQIIRAHQKDLFNVFTLREDTENVLRAWFGTRWLTRWALEVELSAKLVYYGLTTLRGTQTLGEEYVDIRPISMRTRKLPALKLRAALILLPTLPSYLIARFSRHFPRDPDSVLSRTLKLLPNILETLSEINLAAFYLSGTYYGLIPRLLRTRSMSSVALDPNQKPPSYSFLGILLAIRLLYRLHGLLAPVVPSTSSLFSKPLAESSEVENAPALKDKLTYIDSTPISTLVPRTLASEEDDGKDLWGDRTLLDLESFPLNVRAERKCALCLEERTASTVTECGHLFCWTCVVGWGREKAECPLCRQSLSLSKLLPVYNI